MRTVTCLTGSTVSAEGRAGGNFQSFTALRTAPSKSFDPMYISTPDTFPSESTRAIAEASPSCAATLARRGYTGNVKSTGSTGVLLISVTLGCGGGTSEARYISEAFSVLRG